MYQAQKQTAITLIALVITIVILIILAGVGMSLSLGDNGIFTKAEQAKEMSIKADIKEKVETKILEVQMEAIEVGENISLQLISNKLEAKDENITLETYNPENNFINGTYNLNGTEYEFKITEKYEVIVGEKGKEKPLTFGTPTWSNGKAIVEISTKTGGIIEYQVNGTEGTWTRGTTVENLNHTDVINARVTDGAENVSEIVSLTVKDTIEPEEFTITTSDLTYEGLTVTGQTTDNQTGLANYTYVAQASTGNKIEYPGETVTTKEITGLAPETEYNVYMLAYDNAGNVRKSNVEKITTPKMPVAKMFGQYVDYGIDLNEDGDTTNDWMIFYKEEDETSPNYGNTYIIAANYLDLTKRNHLEVITNAGMTKSNKSIYEVLCDSNTTYTTITDSVKTRFMVKPKFPTINDNLKGVSLLLDTSKWECFVTNELNEKGGTAIGGATIEMWVASWNKIYPNEQIRLNMNDNGYNLDGNNQYNDKSGFKDAPNIYFPYKDNSSLRDMTCWMFVPKDRYTINDLGGRYNI